LAFGWRAQGAGRTTKDERREAGLVGRADPTGTAALLDTARGFLIPSFNQGPLRAPTSLSITV
jgi:hypothetical protein